jgi:ABC-type polysaccharide/polyol phosphate export permease
LGNVSRHVLRFWFYLSPTLYGLDEILELKGTDSGLYPVIEAWYKINPFTYLLGSYRNVIYEGTAPDWLGLLVIALLSVVMLALSVLLFKRLEPSFAKVL